MNIYTLSQVSVTHGGRRILDVDALSLERGLTYSLQGPNGAGKSTLLGILSFLSPPHDGEVRFEDTPVVWTETYLRPCGGRWVWWISIRSCSAAAYGKMWGSA